jgi:UDP-N-acetylmuramyl pentapeptide synthase
MPATRTRSVEPIVRRTRPIIEFAKIRIALLIVALYRSLLRRTIFIGVAGSCSKTTTKELIAAVPAARFRGRNRGGALCW